ncbi:MAG: hypothetical protein M3Z05_02455 [Gemmatimonadota bacterium]|nr:hypothetical protein [Gemmatimonadota bacterium]
MATEKLDQILDALNARHQRATYGAVAAVIGAAPRTLMSGRDRDQRHSWVVSRKTGQPTGYEPEQVHGALETVPHVIDSREALEQWLASESGALVPA